MQGRGVSNYDINKPSHEITTATTEFDDELMRRGIVSLQQVVMAKGASSEEANRLVEEAAGQTNPPAQSSSCAAKSSDHSDTDDSDQDLLDNDDDFFARYREQRMGEISHNEDPTVTHISRAEWKSKVNEASYAKWVLVMFLDSADPDQNILQVLHNLARKYSSLISIVTIRANDAVPNWPPERVPALFAYRAGVKREEWVSRERHGFPDLDLLVHLLEQWNVFDVAGTP